MDQVILQPIVQYAFAGFCAVLLVIIIWLIKQLLEITERNNDIISHLTKALAENTATVRTIQQQTHEEHKEFTIALYALRDQLMRRRCLLTEE